MRPKATIQAAVDAIPNGPGGNRAAGRVYVPSKGGGGNAEKYDETVVIDGKRMIVEGDGPGTKIDPGGGQSGPTVEVIDSDDAQLHQMWVNNKGSGDAIKLTSGEELWVRDMNVDRAGQYALNLAPTSANGRCYIGPMEVKGGEVASFFVDIEECFFWNIHCHDELGGKNNENTIDKGFIFDGCNRFSLDHAKISLNDATEVFDYNRTPDDMQMNSVYIGPDRQTNGSTTNPVDLRGTNSIFANMIIRDDLTMQFATDAVFHGVVTGSVTHGTRTVINGLSPNAGDPSTTGQWNGNSDLAFKLGATVVDTSNEGDTYIPLPTSATNDWVRHSGTAV